MCDAASDAVDAGQVLLILSDTGVDREHAAIPMLMATGAVHHHLIRQGTRLRVSLLVETAEAWDVHHMACLIGYGASAVNPYLAFATVTTLIQTEAAAVQDPAQLERFPTEPVENCRTALDYGLRKIMSKRCRGLED